MHNSHRRNVMDVTKISKESAMKALKRALRDVENAFEYQAELEGAARNLETFSIMARGHATASPFVSLFRKVIAEYAQNAPRGVFAALLIEALNEHFPDMPRPTSRVPQAILATALQGFAVEDLHGRGYGTVIQIKSAIKKVLDSD